MPRQFAEKLASKMLARDGVGAIWELHILAANEYRKGRLETAEALIVLADAAEREWLRGTD
jgi:hypothetical protein